MDRERLHHPSHLFTVRLWQEEVGNDKTEWRGKVQHLTSGEGRYFREWSVLIACPSTLNPTCSQQGKALRWMDPDATPYAIPDQRFVQNRAI